MSQIRVFVVVAALLVLLVRPVGSQQPGGASKTPPRLVPVAETRLLMEGITQANFQGLEKLLKNREIDAEGWTFGRGQALLIAECGNLLMLRPPKNSGQEAWMKAATELRESASNLSRTMAGKDIDRSRLAMNQLASACNKCHQTFRVPARVDPAEPRKP